jgi:hypothetical protein
MRDEKCRIQDADDFLKQSIHRMKRTLINAFIDQRTSSYKQRDRRQINRGMSIECIHYE